MIARLIIPLRKLVAAGAAICAAGAGPARAQDALSSLASQASPIDTPDGPKEQLRRVGITSDAWVTQIYQGEPGGDASKTWAYGGKVDGFLKIDAEKLGLWSGLHVNVQYEHYFGENINRRDFALIPVNTAQAYLGEGTFHSALSISVTQDLSEQVSVSAGKFNMMTLASRTPLIGGGGIDTFMNRALALPSTGVAYTAARGGAANRVVISAPYLIGGLLTIKTAPVNVTFGLLDPRSAENPKVVERPFEKGVAAGVSATFPTEIFGLNGFHTFRAAYSDARGVDLDEIAQIRPLAGAAIVTKKGYWFGSYAIQQNLFQSESDPAVGWGLFGLVAQSDGNPTPINWNMLAGLAGNNLLEGRENDRWGVGFFHYGVTEPLLAGLAALGFARRGEGGVEGFYNFAITPWLRLSADLQVIDPWNPSKQRGTYTALRLQTKF